MPNWNQVLTEILDEQKTQGLSALDVVRRRYLHKLAERTGRNVIAYYSGFLQRPNMAGVEINDDDKNGFMLCVHELDRRKGLDLILHTPGGNIAATQSLVHYLREMFGRDIRALIPQIAMSAGTLIACSCKAIVMGKQSNLGPTDPQLSGFPAIAVRAQFDEAYDQIMADTRAANVWQPILAQLGPSFLKECDWAIDWARDFLESTLLENMLKDVPEAARCVKEIVAKMTGNDTKRHDRHYHYQECISFGLTIESLEADPGMQDDLLTVHHCFMHTLSIATCLKITENHLGRALIKNIVPA